MFQIHSTFKIIGSEGTLNNVLKNSLRKNLISFFINQNRIKNDKVASSQQMVTYPGELVIYVYFSINNEV